MSEKQLYMTVGLPRSGKSTWARKQGLPIVSPDAIRLILHGKAFLAKAEDTVWILCYFMVKALFQAGHTHVILDACSTSRKRRDGWKSKHWKRQFIIFDTPVEECKLKTDDKNMHEVITRMSEGAQPINNEVVSGESVCSVGFWGSSHKK